MKKISNTTWCTHTSCWSLSSLTRTTQIRHLPMRRLTHKHIFLSKAMNSHLMCSYINIILHLCLSGVCRMNSDVYISSSQTDAMQRYKKKKKQSQSYRWMGGEVFRFFDRRTPLRNWQRAIKFYDNLAILRYADSDTAHTHIAIGTLHFCFTSFMSTSVST